jgi:hypothetical protein
VETPGVEITLHLVIFNAKTITLFQSSTLNMS